MSRTVWIAADTDGSRRRLPVVGGFFLLGLRSHLGTVGEPIARDEHGHPVPIG